jgi:hypothetical protein
VWAKSFSIAIKVGPNHDFATTNVEDTTSMFCAGTSNVSNLTWSCHPSRISHRHNLDRNGYLSGRWSRTGFKGGLRLRPVRFLPLWIQKEDEAIASSSILRSLFNSVRRERPLPSKWRLHPLPRGPLRTGSNAAGVVATVSLTPTDYPKSAGRSDPQNWVDEFDEPQTFSSLSPFASE